MLDMDIMMRICEFCKLTALALIYCPSDSVYLCYYCDVLIHSANFVSSGHIRFFVCRKCHLFEAVVQCIPEKIILCESCECSHLDHIIYNFDGRISGCPSVNELCKSSSFYLQVLDGLDNSFSSMGSPSCVYNASTHHALVESKCDGLSIGSSSSTPYNAVSSGLQPDLSSLTLRNPKFVTLDKEYDQQTVGETSMFKEDCSIYNNIDVWNNGDLLDNLNGDGLAMNKDDIIIARDQSINPTVDGVDCKANKDCLVTEFSGIHIDNAPTVPEQDNVAVLTSLKQVKDDIKSNTIVGSCNANAGLSYPTPPIHPNIPYEISHTTRREELESRDYTLMTNELPWKSNFDITFPSTRDNALKRYKEKKKLRVFEKKIRYASRKSRADTRKREKGRFIKATEEGNAKEECVCD